MLVKLERYLARIRRRLDVESPDDQEIWRNIRKDLDRNVPEAINIHRYPRLIRFRNIAAAAIILFSLGYIANDIINGKQHPRKITLSSIDKNLGSREQEYIKLINYKTIEVKPFENADDTIINEIFREIRNLDLVYNQALADLKEMGPDEKVINTIFNTYEQKIRLLELIVLETNKKKSHEKNEKPML